MARRSRKQGSTDLTKSVLSVKSQTGIYARLSVMDNGYQKRDSIENQVALLREYVDLHPDEFVLKKEYVDNGVTGTNFDRAAWKELLADIKRGEINCVLVKDFSRIGRNYIEVGNYLEKIFPFLGVRVVAINETFDSRLHQFHEKMLISSLTNIVNEYYARDISVKITQTKRTLQRNGEFVSPVVPYGYTHSKKNKKKLIIDEETADIIRKIYEWRVSGKGCLQIARYLNDLVIPSPGLYRYMNGNHSFKRCCNSKWQSKHVAGILVNPVYLGHMVQGKTRTSYFVQEGKITFVPKEQWIVVENTHEAIITQEQFELAGEMAAQSKGKHNQIVNANKDVEKVKNYFEKKIFCGQCGRLMTRRSRVKNGKRNYCFFCNTPNVVLNGHCKNTYIHEIAIIEAVRESIKKQFQMMGLSSEWSRKGFSDITLDLMGMLIEKIVVFSPERIEITFSFSNNADAWFKILKSDEAVSKECD